MSDSAMDALQEQVTTMRHDLEQVKQDLNGLGQKVAIADRDRQHGDREVAAELSTISTLVTDIHQRLGLMVSQLATTKATAERVDGWAQKVAWILISGVLLALVALITNQGGA